MFLRTLLFYGFIAIVIAAFIRLFGFFRDRREHVREAKHRFRLMASREVWVQVYDTDSSEEAQALRAKLQEEEVERLVYEQGRKDVHGNPLKRFGIAVPRTSVPLAQKLISRRLA